MINVLEFKYNESNLPFINYKLGENQIFKKLISNWRLCSIAVSISASRAEDLGSTPNKDAEILFLKKISRFNTLILIFLLTF